MSNRISRFFARPTGPLMGVILLLAVVLRAWYGLAEPNADRFFDERISMTNIESILETGSLRPRTFWYQTLSYLPQAALLATAEKIWQLTGWEALQVRDARGFRPIAYHLCRSLMVLWGALSLLLTFSIARRLFSDWVALLGAALLAVSPLHIVLSVRFKPDGLLLLACLVSFWWILDLAERPRLGGFLKVGLGIGWAMSVKLNGITVASPLLVLAVVWLRRDGRDKVASLLGLGLSGVVAATLYLFTNPWLRETWAALQANREIYQRQAGAAGDGHFDVLARSITSLFEPFFHGWLIALAALAGLALLVLSSSGRARTAPWPGSNLRSRLATWLFLAYPLGHTVFYTVTTTRFKENHHALVLPFTSLAAAFFLAEAVGRLARSGWPRAMAVSSIVMLFSWSSAGAVAHVYRDVVPTSFERVISSASARWSGDAPRLLCREGEEDWEKILWAGEAGIALAHFARFDGSTAFPLDACDGLVLVAERTRKADNAALLARIARAPRQDLVTIEGPTFHARGPGLILLFNDWQPAETTHAPSIGVSEGGAMTVSLPSCDTSSTAPEGSDTEERWRTVELWVPIARLEDAWPEASRLETASTTHEVLQWRWLGKRGRGHRFLLRRFPCSRAATRLDIVPKGGSPLDCDARLEIRYWRKGPALATDR